MFAGSLLYDEINGVGDRNVRERSEQLKSGWRRWGVLRESGAGFGEQADVVRADFMEELTKLQDDVPALKRRKRLPSSRRSWGNR